MVTGVICITVVVLGVGVTIAGVVDFCVVCAVDVVVVGCVVVVVLG